MNLQGLSLPNAESLARSAPKTTQPIDLSAKVEARSKAALRSSIDAAESARKQAGKSGAIPELSSIDSSPVQASQGVGQINQEQAIQSQGVLQKFEPFLQNMNFSFGGMDP